MLVDWLLSLDMLGIDHILVDLWLYLYTEGKHYMPVDWLLSLRMQGIDYMLEG